LLGELSAVVVGEAHITKNKDAVLHVSRRGLFGSIAKLAAAYGLTLVICVPAMYIFAILIGSFFWWTVSLPLGEVVVALVVVLLLVWVVQAAVFEALRVKGRSEGPNQADAKYRAGVPRTYWLLSNLAALESGMRALPAARSYLPRILPAEDVVVAGGARIRDLYVETFEFTPLAGSTWVLSRPVTLPAKDGIAPIKGSSPRLSDHSSPGPE
jgi:hypothetical protein